MINIGREIGLKEHACSDLVCDSFRSLLDDNENFCDMHSKESGAYSNDTRYTKFTLATSAAPKMDKFVREFLAKNLAEYLELMNITVSLGDIFEPIEIMKYIKDQDKFDPHFDSNGSDHFRSLAFILYLNDVEKGGVLTLPSVTQNIEIKPVKGRLVIVPTDWTHHHFVTSPRSNDRYAFITFFRYAE